MMSSNLRKKLIARVGFAAPALATSMVMAGSITTAAEAFTLVPEWEGEVALDNKQCLTGNCIELDPIVESVESLIDSSTGTRSSLFVDKFGTANSYGDFGFKAKDIGTADTAGNYWFRPVAFNQDGSAIEGGELEVGTFKFTFAHVIETLTVSWFDTEKKGTSYITEVETTNGSFANGDFVPAGKNENIFTKEFENVKSITLDLGQRHPNPRRTGDGVNFQVSAKPVPEPSIMLGLGTVALAGGLARRKQPKASA